MSEQDTREKLEADALDYVVKMAKLCHGMGLRHELWQFNPEPLHMHIRQCLDRQAAITERECLTAAGLAATEAPALQAKVDELTAERNELREALDACGTGTMYELWRKDHARLEAIRAALHDNPGT